MGTLDSLGHLETRVHLAYNFGMIKPPRSWNSRKHLTSVLSSEWYQTLGKIQSEVVKISIEFFFKNRFDFLLLPITTGSVSSPVGLGSDSLPVKVSIGGIDSYLADSMQFYLELACRVNKTVKRAVVASSDKAYGVQKKLPYTEESPLLGLYPYDASKACADILARSYFSTYGLPVAVTRNANTYGGGDLNFSRIIPDAIYSLLEGKQLIIRSDGTPERDYMYVKDAADGYLTLAENLDRKEVQGQAFNFGTGKPISVLNLFDKIAELTGKKDIKPKVLGQAKNEIDRQFLATDKVKKMLNWQPKYSLDEGLKETIEWYKANSTKIR